MLSPAALFGVSRLNCVDPRCAILVEASADTAGTASTAVAGLEWKIRLADVKESLCEKVLMLARMK